MKYCIVSLLPLKNPNASKDDEYDKPEPEDQVDFVYDHVERKYAQSTKALLLSSTTPHVVLTTGHLQHNIMIGIKGYFHTIYNAYLLDNSS